ncbi:MAG: FmdB family transcriptional regulator [Jiangellaceae bacterium]|nr:FmdB family transcriptional regulator [Jiangellaceae bacterium]
MPTYQYACTDCGCELEVVQRFTDDPLTVCPECHGRLRKVFAPVGVVFKGSGFYRTDSREPAKQAASGSDGNGAAGKSDSSPSGNGAAKGEPKTKKPAESTSAA